MEHAAKDLLWFQSGALLMAFLLLVSMFMEASWWTRGIMVLMAAATSISGVIGSITARKLKTELGESRSVWHDVTKYPVRFTEIDEKRFNQMLRAASAFARDEDTIVYYHVRRSDQWNKINVNFGFLNDEARIMFKLKFV